MAWLDWSNIMRLTLDSSKIDSNLTDFPVLITLSSGTGTAGDFDATPVFDEVGPSYKKIAITSADGETQLPVEVEYWDATEEIAHLWTKVPTLYSSVDTTLYLYYDSTKADNVDYVSKATDVHATVEVQANTEGTYDDKTASWPTVLKNNDDYQMWYGMRTITPDRWRIGYCVSSGTLNNWQGHKMIIDLGSEGTYDTVHTTSPTVIKDGSTYKMWYAGHGGSYWSIIYCTSTDGESWSNFQQVMAPGNISADSVHCSTPYVIKDGTTYKMWYGGQDGFAYRVCYAQSTNGTTWTGHQQVINFGTSDAYSQIYPGPVIKEGTTYTMYPSGNDSSNVFRLLHTTSTNGTSWSTPLRVFDVGLEGTYDATRTYSASIINDDGVYRLWYGGWDTTHPYSILYTHSNTNAERWQFGNAAVGVWIDFQYVYRLSQDPSGGTDAIKDSSGRLHHGTSGGSMLTGDLVDGRAGKALDFDGNDDYIDLGDPMNFSNKTFTASAIVKTTATDGRAILGHGTNNANGGWGLYMGYVHGAGCLNYNYGNTSGVSQIYTTASAINNGEFKSVAVVATTDTATQGNNTATLYIDGQPVSATTSLVDVFKENTTNELDIGARIDGSGMYWDGIIDEVRITNGSRSAAWLKAEHHNTFNGLISFDPYSYVEGECTNRYGLHMDDICYVVALDEVGGKVLAHTTAASGTGLFSMKIFGKEPGDTVLVTYSFPGTYQGLTYLAGAEYMTTLSGTTISGGGY